MTQLFSLIRQRPSPAKPWTGSTPLQSPLAATSPRSRLSKNRYCWGQDPFTMLMEMMKRLGSNKHQTECNYTAMWSDACWRCRREA